MLTLGEHEALVDSLNVQMQLHGALPGKRPDVPAEKQLVVRPDIAGRHNSLPVSS